MKITYFDPHKAGFNSTFHIGFEVDFFTRNEIPISFTGYCLYNDNTLGQIFPTERDTEVQFLNAAENNPKSLSFAGYLRFSTQELHFIHEQRLNHEHGDIHFIIFIIFYGLKRYESVLTSFQRTISCEKVIPSSDWIQKICPKLKIGSFTTIEIEHTKITDSPLKEMSKLITSIKHFHDQGSWDLTVYESRKFFELSRKYIKEEMSAIADLYGTDEYPKSLFDIFNNSFNLLSKYAHSTTKSKDPLNLSPTKYDANMALFLSMGAFEKLNEIALIKNGD